MIIISATLDYATREDRDGAVEDSAPVQQATRDDEPGCQAYCFAPDPCVPTRIQVYELWDDGPSLAAHFKHPNYEDMKTALNRYSVVGTANQMYLIRAHEPVYSPEGLPRETFFDGSE